MKYYHRNEAYWARHDEVRLGDRDEFDAQWRLREAEQDERNKKNRDHWDFVVRIVRAPGLLRPTLRQYTPEE